MHENAINWWGIGSQYAEQPALGWSIITFVFFVLALVFAVRKPLAAYLQLRSDQIRKTIEEAAQAKALAQKRVEECEQQLARLSAETARLRAEFVEQGKKEKQALEEAAKRLTEQIKKNTEEAISSEFFQAFDALKRETADLVVRKAAEEIKAHTQASNDQRLYAQFSNELR